LLFAPPVLPFSLFFGLLSLALLGGGAYLIWAWFAGVVVSTGYLVSGIALVAFTFLGRSLVLLLRRPGDNEPAFTRECWAWNSKAFRWRGNCRWHTPV
jgi:hypothetical protein